MLPCHQAGIIWIILLSWRVGGQCCLVGMQAANWASCLHHPLGPAHCRTGCGLALAGMDLAGGAVWGRAASPGFCTELDQPKCVGVGGNGVQRSLGKGMARTPLGPVQSSEGTHLCYRWNPKTGTKHTRAESSSLQACSGVGVWVDPGFQVPASTGRPQGRWMKLCLQQLWRERIILPPINSLNVHN